MRATIHPDGAIGSPEHPAHLIRDKIEILVELPGYLRRASTTRVARPPE